MKNLVYHYDSKLEMTGTWNNTKIPFQDEQLNIWVPKKSHLIKIKWME